MGMTTTKIVFSTVSTFVITILALTLVLALIVG